MDKMFQSWFDQNSGYALHKTPKRKFSTKLCCGEVPAETGKQVLFPDTDSGTMEPFPLCRCKHCGKHYVRKEDSYCLIENLMKVQIL